MTTGGLLLGKEAKLKVVDEHHIFTLYGVIYKVEINTMMKSMTICLSGRDPKFKKRKKKKS